MSSVVIEAAIRLRAFDLPNMSQIYRCHFRSITPAVAPGCDESAVGFGVGRISIVFTSDFQASHPRHVSLFERQQAYSPSWCCICPDPHRCPMNFLKREEDYFSNVPLRNTRRPPSRLLLVQLGSLRVLQKR